jgi:hypothetical protein
MCMNSRADTVMTDETVVALWMAQIVMGPSTILVKHVDPASVWVGFVMGLERYDLATREQYEILARPAEVAAIIEAARVAVPLSVKSRFGG